MSTEKVVQSQIVKAIKAEHPTAWIFKVVGNPYQASGVPDLLVCVEGLLIGIEVKHLKPGESVEHAYGRATALQVHQIEAIKRAGGAAGVALSPEDALRIIEDALASLS